MNRDRKDRLPEMQVDFIDSICCELYKVSEKYVRLGIDRSSKFLLMIQF